MSKSIFENQYNTTYISRIEKLRPYLHNKVQQKWNIEPLISISEIEKSTNNKVAIIGIIFISSNLKNSIFKELSNYNVMKSKNIKETDILESNTYISENIKYFIEDITGRMELEFENIEKIYEDCFVITTGMCVALFGNKNNQGKFLVSDISFAGYQNNKLDIVGIVENKISVPEMHLSEANKNKNEIQSHNVLFISGINMSSKNTNKNKILLIFDYLNGKHGNIFSNIDTVIILGNFYDSEEKEALEWLIHINILIKKAKLTSKIRIIVVPNLNDPSSKAYPIECLNKKLFSEDFESCENPCCTKIDQKTLLITSGENIFDVLRYLPHGNISSDWDKSNIYKKENVTKTMDVLLQSMYLCPTAPDTLLSNPLESQESFYLEKTPDFFICGNTNGFSFTEKNGCVLVTLPSFSKSGEIVVFDINSFKYEIIQFN
ncbi:regulatory subunit B of DNA polymerase delta [Hamiltosporidium tvaerminnensis]|uniref:Regulatory subunit B of DNA polymerase delta n=1 Tax=Hamiltosporidium tvaerminnensis TaxID=1176355 RepID=A0A4Q9L9Y3_9MICR|nr:DNA polymerase delta small subunit Cdc1 [Hamiltosporidium tvaerminnensis]TBU04567.1 regulatory subunit B of DNA polymerase delta [Hamiltosporidium tvaerminnensis]